MLLRWCRATCLPDPEWLRGRPVHILRMNHLQSNSIYAWACLACKNVVSRLCGFGVYLIIIFLVLSLGKSSPAPKVVTVQRPAGPPPPPPRKPPTVPNGGLTPEKPLLSPSTDMQSTFLPSQPLEDNGISNHVDFLLFYCYIKCDCVGRWKRICSGIGWVYRVSLGTCRWKPHWSCIFLTNTCFN